MKFQLLDDTEITYADAIRMALGQSMENDNKILVYGLGVDDPKAMYGTFRDFPKLFGNDRIFDTPLSEDALTGYGIGLALSGYKPIHVHQRTDFLLLCMNQLINMAAKIKYLSNGRSDCPFVVRAITGRSWGQGSQHSQSFHSLLANIPGLRVLTPSTPQDAFNTYRNVFKERCPTIIIEHRMLYKTSSKIKILENVPSTTRLANGDDITVCSISHMSLEASRAIDALNRAGYTCDHFSLVNNSQLDLNTLHESASKTNKLLIVDHGWTNASVGSSIIQRIYELGFRGDAKIIGYQDSPCPTSRVLEQYFYPSPQTILEACMSMLKLKMLDDLVLQKSSEILSFKGPF